MASTQKHGFRHGQRLTAKGIELVVDTRSDEAFVLLVSVSDGTAVVRAAKYDSGRRFRQGTNSDRTGFLAYRVDYRPGWSTGATCPYAEWSEYTDAARAHSVKRWLNEPYALV